MDAFDSKYPVRLRLRLSTVPEATVAAEIQYDSSGEWVTVETAQSDKMRPFYLAIPVQRCDHFRLKLSANGEWRLWAMVVELYEGQYVRK